MSQDGKRSSDAATPTPTAAAATVGAPESVPGPLIATGHGSPAFAGPVSVTVNVQL